MNDTRQADAARIVEIAEQIAELLHEAQHLASNSLSNKDYVNAMSMVIQPMYAIAKSPNHFSLRQVANLVAKA